MKILNRITIGKIIFITIFLISVGYLVYIQYQFVPSIPSKYIYLSLLSLIFFVAFITLTLYVVEKKYKDKDRPYIAKIIGLAIWIVFGFLLYLFAVYVFPGAGEYLNK